VYTDVERLDPKRAERESHAAGPPTALPPRAPVELTPEQLRYLQSTAGNQYVVARLQSYLPQAPSTGASAPVAASQLSDAAARRAVAYTDGLHYDAELIASIQQVVGAVADGIFGPVTARAVADWQAANGLAPDGRPGAATLAAMGIAAGGGVPVPSPGGSAPAAGGGGTSPAVPEPELESPPGPSPFGPEPGASPVSADLKALMAKERLSPDEMDAARSLIAAVADETQRADLFLQLQVKVAYHSQRDNESTEGGKMIGDVMCNLTSLAMCLEYLGVDNPYPEMQFEDALEKIRVEKVGEPRTTSAGWGGVATYLGVKWGFIPGAGANDQAWYESNVKPHLAAGEAVMLSIDGHICRLQGMTSEGLVADDPYGESTLGGGSDRGWDGTNTKEADSTVGEDLVWKWADVKRHKMLWIAWFTV
jgi:peptidoglycan hydrolase-like protein with peptidoglycan-binding domain